MGEKYFKMEAQNTELCGLIGSLFLLHPPQVQRPVTAAMLDCNVLIKELELDVENEGVIYVAGLKKSLTETDLQEEFSQLKDLETLFLPKDLQSGKHRNCCFLSK